MEIDGGMNDRPFGTSYDGYPSTPSGGGKKEEDYGWAYAIAIWIANQ